MFKWINSVLDKLKPEVDLPDNWRELEDHDKFTWVMKKGCLVCLDNPKFKVFMGPSGGMSQNVWCSKCGTRWNVAAFSRDQGIAQLIEEYEKSDRKLLKKEVETIENERRSNENR